MMAFIRKFYLAAVFLFLYAPIAVLIIFSFNASKSRAVWEGFSLQWYSDLLQNEAIISALYYTLSVAVLASLLATIIGTVTAIAMYRHVHPWEREVLLSLTYLPVLNPDIVTGISLMLLFIFFQVDLGFVSLLLAHTIFCVPYVILTILPKLKQFDYNLYEAALDLGASPFYAFRKIVFPEILPGIITGLLFAFTMSIDDFVISFFTTGSGINNLSILIYSMARRGINPTINALSTIIFFSVLLLLLIINKRLTESEQKNEI